MRIIFQLNKIPIQISDDSGVQMTFSEIRLKTIRAAQNLQQRGYKEKQVFGFMAKNSQHLSQIVFASFCLGCPINPLDTSLGKTEVMHMLNITKPSLMFCDTDVYDLVNECLKELGNNAKVITLNGKKGNCEQAEDLFVETKKENLFM